MNGLDLGKLFVGITVDKDGAIKDLNAVKGEIKNAGEESNKHLEKLNETGKKLTSLGGDLTKKVTLPIAGMGAVAFKFASDLEDALGATDQIFKGSSEQVKKWADNLESYYGIAESEALEYANTMGAMLKNIGGLSEEEAAKQSATLIELAGDLTAMFGGTTESAVQALTGALKGNNSMLDNYGMGVNEATIKTKALEMGLIAEGESLDLAGKQAATLALIMEQTADAQGQASREADGASGSMRGLLTELKNVATNLGEVLLPIITPFITKLKEVVQSFGAMSPEMQKSVVLFAGIAAIIPPIIMVVGKLMTSISAIGTALGSMGGAMALLTNPITLVVGAIVGLIAIFTALYKNNEDFRDSVNESWENIKNTISNVTDAIQNLVQTFLRALQVFWETWGDAITAYATYLFDNMMGIFDIALTAIVDIFNIFTALFSGDWEGFWTAIGDLFSNLITGIINLFKTNMDNMKNIMDNIMKVISDIWNKVWDSIKTFLSDTWKNIVESIKTNTTNVINSVKTMATNMIDALKNLPSQALQIGKDFVMGMINGIGNMAGALASKAREMANNAVSAVKNTLGIRSPSRVMMEMGEYTAEGFALGIEDSADMVNGAIGNLTAFTNNKFAIPTSTSNMLNGANRSGTGQGSTSTTHNNTVAPQIHIHVGSVRNDGDIKNIGRELQKTMTQFNRTLGVV